MNTDHITTMALDTVTAFNAILAFIVRFDYD